MKTNRKLEREIWLCPEMDKYDKETYPMFEESEVRKVLKRPTGYGEECNFMPYIRENNGIVYIDLYFVDKSGFISRFIIREGYRLIEWQEKDFLSYLSGIKNWDSCRKLYEMTVSLFPNWNLSLSRIMPFTILGQLYFSSHHSGPREILYKAGLTTLAWNLSKFESCNIYGTTPEEIMGHGLSIKALRIMDNLYDYEFSDAYLNKFAETYNKFSDYIGRTLPTDNQYEYLMSICTEGTVFSKLGFNRRLYNVLDDDCMAFEDYRKYYEILEEHPELKTKWIPEVSGIDDVICGLNMLIKNTDNIQVSYQNRWIEDHLLFEYSNNKYMIIMPKTGWEVFLEASRQHNCLMTLAELHSTSKTTILFLRKKDNPNKNFVTIELCNNRIKQAKAFCNEDPDDEVFEFLLEYSDAKNLYLEERTNKKRWEGRDVDEEFFKYIDSRNNMAA